MEHWTVVPDFAVRTTGFPIELLESLRLVRTTSMVQQLLRLDRDIEHMRSRMLVELLPRAVRDAAHAGARQRLKILSTWRKQVTRRQRIVPAAEGDGWTPVLRCAARAWNATIGHADALRLAAERTWIEEHEHARAALWQLATDARLLEAIWLSNPDVYHTVVQYAATPGAPQRSSAVRRIERSLISYVQRLCTKNETNSFFGPINYGRLDPSASRSLEYARSSTTIRQRTSFATQWMAESLASAMLADSRLLAYVKPRPGTRWRQLTPDVLEDTASSRQLSLDSADSHLIQYGDGTRTVFQLAKALDEDWRATWQRVERFDKAGVLVARLLVPGDRFDPLGYLLEWLSAVPADVDGRDHWCDLVATLQREVAALSRDELPVRLERLARIDAMFVAATGRPARRRGGAMYADRALVFEECLGDLERFVLGGPLAQTITQRLQPVLRLWRTAARLRAERDQRAAGHVWARARTSAIADTVPLIRFLAEAQRTPLQREFPDDRLSQLLANMRELVRARSDGHCARISSDDLRLPELPPESDACAYTSVDLLIDAASEAAIDRGDYTLVLGEAHAPPLLWVFPTAYYAGADFGDSVLRAIAEQPGAALAAQVALARDTKIYPLPLPGRTVELRPVHPQRRAVPAAAVDVRSDDGAVSLWRGDQRLRLYPPLKRRGTADPFAGLAFPGIEMLTIETGEHTPRIEVDGVVYQRERWTLPAGSSTLGEPGRRDFDLFLSACRWKERHALPDEIFVRVPNEPKPVYVDFRNQLLIEMFDHLAAQNDQLVITEMLPRSGGTWLAGRDGHYSAEYRVVAVADPCGGPAV